ncbi:cystathionine gamma-synthase/methionine-gamma-lyase [Streptomyces sp. MnatMP-M27]|uniref:trans-sulfuration enzyme family protein n=1 Tax=Streptomyces sp. MnatMP-M27 TaxID=1839768 RepID=UPI00081F6661|nr:cystathionine gamma-synthase/methionine-gamma-lyase [Streptomyces sp. MnatMP-M27]
MNTGPSQSVLHAPQPVPPQNRPVTPALFQTTAWQFSDLGQMDGIFSGQIAGAQYGTVGMPNNLALETALGRLEGAEASVVANGGMAAIAGTLLTLLGPGKRVIVGREGFSWTLGLLRDLEQWGLEHTAIDLTDLDAVEAALRDETHLVFAETVSNPRLRVPDLSALSTLTHAAGALLAVDNTFATPFHCTPLALGADLVIESATKFLGGHSDAVLGAVSGKTNVIEPIRRRMVRLGSIAAPMDSWLIQRGLMTFVVRMERASRTAAAIAEWLAAHPAVGRVFYPGLTSHPDQEVAAKVLDRGFGAMVTFELAPDFETVNEFTRRLHDITLVHSLGGTQTSLSHPASSSHRLLSAEELSQVGLHPGVLRMSVGLEEPDDLIAELATALGG